MFVALSRFTVANGMHDAVREAFLARPHLVDRVPGFVRMEVLRPQGCPEEFWLMTWWSDETCFDAWHRSHAYHDSHAGMPKGLKLVPGSTEIRRLERIAE
ncbi:antibiotic biosynthesis monooxygenase [Candidatus Accumulibacter sp. ACC007]|uniref:antibiotic biosynthesis monooxygenase family protein n=1 Tax=Candidatus Accumulibacter sp. ACC007 TaxID=2823333 RepID=UPI0025C54116|nr:antibiotic biosynthesis monooxygenase [Candidatus Accumulibacter sp. ACC007]